MALTRTLYFNTCWHRAFTVRLSTSAMSNWLKPTGTQASALPSSSMNVYGGCENSPLCIRSMNTHPLTHKHVYSWSICPSTQTPTNKLPGQMCIFSRCLSDEKCVDKSSPDGENKKRRAPSTFILEDEEWARAMARVLKKVIDFKNEHNLVVECNPEHGLLTEWLLFRSKLKIACVQYRKTVSPMLKDVMEKGTSKGRIFLKHGNITDLRYLLKDIIKMNGVTRQNEGCSISIVGTTFPYGMHANFINVLSYDLGYQSHIYSLGLVDIYLFVEATELKVLGLDGGDYLLFNGKLLRSALYKVLYKVRVLMEIPSDAFYRPTNHPKPLKSKLIYLIRISPRSDLYDVLPPQQIPRLISLLKYIRKKSSKSTIYSAIQARFPVSITDLENLGFSSTDTICNMSPDDVIKLHQMLESRPDCLFFDNEGDHNEKNSDYDDRHFDDDKKKLYPVDDDMENTNFDDDYFENDNDVEELIKIQ